MFTDVIVIVDDKIHTYCLLVWIINCTRRTINYKLFFHPGLHLFNRHILPDFEKKTVLIPRMKIQFFLILTLKLEELRSSETSVPVPQSKHRGLNFKFHIYPTDFMFLV